MLSEFLVVAAVLVELKSRRLLPGGGEVEPDEELVGWEERDLLLARLLECQAYGPRPTASPSSSSRPPARCPGPPASTPTSSSGPPTCWRG